MDRKWIIILVIVILVGGILGSYLIMKKKNLETKDTPEEEKKKMVESLEKFKLLIGQIKTKEDMQSFIDYFVAAGIITPDRILVSPPEPDSKRQFNSPDPSKPIEMADFAMAVGIWDTMLFYDEEFPEDGFTILNPKDLLSKDAIWNISSTKATVSIKKESEDKESSVDYNLNFIKKDRVWYVSFI